MAAEDEMGAGPAGNPAAPKTACFNCRKQKIACRNSATGEPCSRCHKLGISCTYERRYVRGQKRKEELEQGVDSSKRPLHISVPKDGMNNGTALPARTSQGSMPLSPLANSTQQLQMRMQPFIEPGSEKSIDGIHLNSATIHDLFSIYFSHFSPFLPILDSSIHPDEYYSQSPLLFWSIASVASRKYTKDPTLVTVLPAKALDLAMKTIFSATAGIPAIESMLLLLSWPPPPDATYDQIPYVLSSALIHAAMRIGLQIPHASDEFSRLKLKLSEKECHRRFRLWTYCHILYQSPSLRLQKGLQDVVTKATLSFAENGLDLDSVQQQRSFDILFKTFIDRITSIEVTTPPTNGLDRIYVAIARVYLHSFQFFRPSDKHNDEELLALYASACTLISELESQEKTAKIVSHGTYYMFQGLLLSADFLLRLLKTPIASFTIEDGERLLFVALDLLNSISVVDNDHPAKSAGGLRNIWSSGKVFKHKDGSWDLDLRVRNRFALSIGYDVMLRHLEEFGDEIPGKSVPELSTEQAPSLYLTDEYLFSDMALSQEWMVNDWWSYPSLAPGIDDGTLGASQSSVFTS